MGKNRAGKGPRDVIRTGKEMIGKWKLKEENEKQMRASQKGRKDGVQKGITHQKPQVVRKRERGRNCRSAFQGCCDVT